VANGSFIQVLDIGTELGRLDEIQGGRWVVKVFPTCGEASVTWSRLPLTDDSREAAKAGREAKAAVMSRVPQPVQETSEERSVRRARAEVRRYGLHNRLDQMVTFTFAGDPPPFDSLGEVVHNFWKRFYRRAEREGLSPGQRFPYVWVPEWGKVSRRLHLHMAVSWWDALGCVEVCQGCARDALKAVRKDLPPVGSFCVGCVWGHGFVGRPESNQDGRSLSKYLTKYLTKDLAGSEVKKGGQRYHCGEGQRPASARVEADSAYEGVLHALSVVRAIVGAEDVPPVMFAPASDSEWSGPPVVILDFKQIGTY
jgi:hypothetical protein